MWRIDGSQASLSSPVFSARVNLERPDRGLFDVNWRHSFLPDARLLQFRLSENDDRLPLADAYIRGTDLVAVYQIDSGQSLATQVYWRFAEPEDLAAVGVELIVSVQTELLDFDPSLTFGSETPCADLVQGMDRDAKVFQRIDEPGGASDRLLLREGVGLFIRRLNDAISYVEMVHASDFCSAEFAWIAGATACVRSRFPMFEQRLEKGVIRRARAQGLLCPRDGDEAVAWECYLRFLASESPLTT